MVRNLANFHWNPPFGGVRLHSTYGLKMPLLLRVAAPSNSTLQLTAAIAASDELCVRRLQVVFQTGELMRTIKITLWQDGQFFIGFLNDYPDYLTQGSTKEELTDNLKSLLIDFESGEIPYLRKVEELLVA